MLSEFIDLIRSQIDNGIYVWGGQGQVATEALIRKMETSTANANRAIALLNKRRSEAVDPILMFDCSGLAIWALQTLGLINYDTTANSLMRMCKVTTTPKVGDFAFSNFTTFGVAKHMGIVTQPGYVTEAKGRDDGVIESMSKWTKYGENPFIKEESDTMLARGDKGTAVTYWQKSLLKAGYILPKYGADSDYGSETEAATKAFQAKVGLPMTGYVDTNTFAYMCNVLQGITTADPALKAELATTKATLSKAITDLGTANTFNKTLSAKIERARTELA